VGERLAERRDPAHRSGERTRDGRGRRERLADGLRAAPGRRAQWHRVDPGAQSLRHHREELAAPLRDRARSAMTTPELPVLRDEPSSDPYVVRGWDSRAPRPGLPPRTLRAASAIA